MPSNVPHEAANAKLDKLGVGAATTGSSLPSLSKSKERKETSTPRKSLETKAKEAVSKRRTRNPKADLNLASDQASLVCSVTRKKNKR
jgi:hypothetical protein